MIAKKPHDFLELNAESVVSHSPLQIDTLSEHPPPLGTHFSVSLVFRPNTFSDPFSTLATLKPSQSSCQRADRLNWCFRCTILSSCKLALQLGFRPGIASIVLLESATVVNMNPLCLSWKSCS